jgi:hypothetical protein
MSTPEVTRTPLHHTGTQTTSTDEGKLSIGGVLHYINWMTPEYIQKVEKGQTKTTGGKIELANLSTLSKVFRKADLNGPDKEIVLNIAHSIEDWSSFGALPFHIRASVIHVTQHKKNISKSYCRICAAECFKSFMHVIK